LKLKHRKDPSVSTTPTSSTPRVSTNEGTTGADAPLKKSTLAATTTASSPTPLVPEPEPVNEREVEQPSAALAIVRVVEQATELALASRIAPPASDAGGSRGTASIQEVSAMEYYFRDLSRCLVFICCKFRVQWNTRTEEGIARRITRTNSNIFTCDETDRNVVHS
jgi:hypothetical protein